MLQVRRLKSVLDKVVVEDVAGKMAKECVAG